MKLDKTRLTIVIILGFQIVILSFLINTIFYQQDRIEILQDNNYQWCNLFVQQANYTEFIIQSEWNESFRFKGYPNCELLR